MKHEMSENELQQLAEKISRGIATGKEIAIYNSWFNAFQSDQGWDAKKLGSCDAKKEILFYQINSEISKKRRARIRSMVARLTVAASILFCGYLAFYNIAKDKEKISKIGPEAIHDILPGANKAVLTLSNGKKITLTDSKNGMLSQQAGIKIIKKTDGELEYSPVEENDTAHATTAYNIVETPNAGQYQLTLSDGTKVWLNAGSSLNYPVAFNEQERRVELKGEAYFEVAHNAAKPFKVTCSGQIVEVLGTHFNINSYADESIVKTTLLKGSVKIINASKQAVIKSGQQSQVNLSLPGEIRVLKNVDMEEALAWRNGLFYFKNSSIKQVMYSAARWYDLKVIYEGKIPEVKLSGKLSRQVNLTGLINILKFEGIECKIDGRTVYILN
jgi:transmembrane sensor